MEKLGRRLYIACEPDCQQKITVEYPVFKDTYKGCRVYATFAGRHWA
jgi:hypothetical protein